MLRRPESYSSIIRLFTNEPREVSSLIYNRNNYILNKFNLWPDPASYTHYVLVLLSDSDSRVTLLSQMLSTVNQSQSLTDTFFTSLKIKDKAYLRMKDQLIFLDRPMRTCTQLMLSQKNLELFDAIVQRDPPPPIQTNSRELSDLTLHEITAITDQQNVIQSYPPLTLTYSFELPARSYLEELQRHAASVKTMVPLSLENQVLAKIAIGQWEKTVNFKFVMNNSNPNILFVESSYPRMMSDPVPGLTVSIMKELLCYYRRPESFDQDSCIATQLRNYVYYQKPSPFFHYISLTPASHVHTFVHELGHVLGLNHQFNWPNASRQFTTTFSVMNYDTIEYRLTRDSFGHDQLMCTNYISISPSEVDLRAVELLYGRYNGNAGDNLYNLTALSSSYTTLVHNHSYWHIHLFNLYTDEHLLEAIVDYDGINTLSAKGMTGDVTLNLNSGLHYRSSLKKSEFTLVGQFSNAIGGNQRNTFFLNNRNNIIDTRHSQGPNRIITNAESQQDLMINFNPRRDSITIEKTQATTLSWKLYPSLPTNITLANEKITVPAGTVINFGRNNTLTLAGISPSQLDASNINVVTVSEAEALNRIRFLQPDQGISISEIVGTIQSNAVSSASTSFILQLNNYLLEKCNCSSVAIETADLILRLAIATYTGSFTCMVTNQFIVNIGQLLGYSKVSSQCVGYTAGTALEAIHNCSWVGWTRLLVGTGASYLGSRAGYRLGLFACKKIDTIIKLQQEESPTSVKNKTV